MEIESEVFDQRLESVRSRLFDRRDDRIHPLKDDKVLADWNGLMIAALARAGRVFEESDWIDAARKAATFMLDRMQDGDDRLHHRWRQGELSVPAFLDDHVFLIWAMLELYDATFEPQYLEHAVALQDTTDRLFWDAVHGGYFFSADDNETLLVRQKEVYDGAIPSGNSVAARNLIRLARLTGRSELAARAQTIFNAFAAETARGASAHSHMADAILLAHTPSLEVVIAGEVNAPQTRALLEQVHHRYLPQAVTLVVPPGPTGDPVRKAAPFTEHHLPIDGVAAAFVCRNHACKMPTTDPGELGRILDESIATTPD
jgi:uncharacterized protein YyaL (SSP411 family)